MCVCDQSMSQPPLRPWQRRKSMRPGSQGEKRIRSRVCRRLSMTLGSLRPGLFVGEIDEKWENHLNNHLVSERVPGQIWLENCSWKRLAVGWTVKCRIMMHRIYIYRFVYICMEWTCMEVMFWSIGRWIQRSLHLGQILFEPSSEFKGSRLIGIIYLRCSI